MNIIVTCCHFDFRLLTHNLFEFSNVLNWCFRMFFLQDIIWTSKRHHLLLRVTVVLVMVVLATLLPVVARYLKMEDQIMENIAIVVTANSLDMAL